MATTKSELDREAIRRTLLHYAGGDPDASAVAEATLSIWRQVAARLAPVIGARGVDVLFSRSLHLTSKIFPWFAIAGDKRDNSALFASIKSCLAGREVDTAAEAGYILLVTFSELLTTLIGESLAGRLLSQVWVSTPPAAEKETES